MKIKILFLFSFLLCNTTYSMKRPLEIAKHITSHKKQKLDAPTSSFSSLLTFFASNTQLKKAWGEIAQEARNNQQHCEKPKNYRAKAIVINTPLDIKKTIAQQSIFSHQEWWYTANKRSYQEIPYAVSFINNNTLIVGLYNGTLEIVDLITNQRLLSLKTPKRLLSISKNTTNDILACGFNDGTIESFTIHQLKTNPFSQESSQYILEPLHEFTTNSPVWSLSFTPTNDIVIGEENGAITCLSSEGKTLFSHQTNDRVYGLLAHTDQKSITCGLKDGTVSILNTESNTIADSFTPMTQPNLLFSLSSNENREINVIGSEDGTVQFIDSKTNHTVNHFNLHNGIYSICLNNTGDHLAAGLDNDTVLILKRYTSPTPDQTMLKKAIHLSMQVKKPHKSIRSADSLLSIIAYQFKLNHAELTKTWKSFPKEIQDAIWLNAKRIIYKYGKRQSSIEEFCNAHNLSTIKLRKIPSIEKYHTSEESRSQHNKIRRILHFWSTSDHPILPPINSIDSLFSTISVLYNLRKVALKNIWNTFSEKTQNELINHYIPSQK